MFAFQDEVPDSRRAARRAVHIACDVILSGRDRPVQLRCTDLSPYGLWLATPGFLDGRDLPVKSGDAVIVSFRPPRAAADDEELTLFARVRRVDADGAGLEFEGLNPLERDILHDALRGMPPRFPH